MGDLTQYTHDELILLLFFTAIAGFLIGASALIFKNFFYPTSTGKPSPILSETEELFETLESYRLHQIDKILSEKANNDTKVKRAQEITSAVSDFKHTLKNNV